MKVIYINISLVIRRQDGRKVSIADDMISSTLSILRSVIKFLHGRMCLSIFVVEKIEYHLCTYTTCVHIPLVSPPAKFWAFCLESRNISFAIFTCFTNIYKHDTLDARENLGFHKSSQGQQFRRKRAGRLYRSQCSTVIYFIGIEKMKEKVVCDRIWTLMRMRDRNAITQFD